MTRAMFDGMDDFWRMRAWLDISALRDGAARARRCPSSSPGRAAARAFRASASFAATARWRAMREAAVAACRPYDFVLSPTAPIAGLRRRAAVPDQRSRAAVRAHRLHAAVQHERAAGGEHQLRPHRRRACRSACRSSAIATTTSACCRSRAPGKRCGRRRRRGRSRRRPDAQRGDAMTRRDPRGNPVSDRVGGSARRERARALANDVVLRHADRRPRRGDRRRPGVAPAAPDEGGLPAQPHRARARRRRRGAARPRSRPRRRRPTRASAPHLGALQRLAAGDWLGASDAWSAILLPHPRDALALQWAHLFDFYRGDSAQLRDRVGARAAAWPDDDPLHPYVLALHAFGLEESGAVRRRPKRPAGAPSPATRACPGRSTRSRT